ncbi:MAG: MMPL family transporter [Deltaproteobacteria bacterium]|nr:MMPL family transporter [Deltaproteobacteria bacterium]
MKKFSLVEFSINRPKTILIIAAVLSVIFLTQFPKIKIDTNPKNMLPPSSDVRVLNDRVDKTFGLYEDMMVLGVVNDLGVVNTATLQKIKRIISEIEKIEGVASRDVNGFTTITNVEAEDGALLVGPLLRDVPETKEGLEAFKKSLLENPLFVNRVISADATTTAIYIPLVKGTNGKIVADKLKEIVAKEGGPEKFYVAGDPVARDTFGAVMFKLMAVFSPIAGVIMLFAVYIMFRSAALSVSLMGAAMISIIWSMGLLIALGFPVHIMSSMAPVFLMAIATDGIHIFNEYFYKLRECPDKRTAILETMREVGRPVKYTALATTAAFAVLLFMQIVPVKVFGGLIAFGTVMLRLLSFSFIPAILMLVDDKKLKAAKTTDEGSGFTARALASLAGIGARKPLITAIVGAVVVVISIVGVSKLVVNNNMVGWFKKNSEIRVADDVMSKALGGTSLGYVIATAENDGYMYEPEALRYIDGLQRHLEKLPVVGKTGSVVDFVKRINLVLHDNDKAYDVVPADRKTVGQYLFLFSMSAKPADLENVVDFDYKSANVWVQLKSWDASAMQSVVDALKEYEKQNPSKLKLEPAGTAYFNLVWNHEVLWDMLMGFIIALIVVFVILALNFRSIKWAIVGYVPLLFTILLIYGVVGFIGKDFDMPISVLSCLSLGMAVDFAIHFISRFKQRLTDEKADVSNLTAVKDALLWTAARPGKGIMRNAVLFASAFSVMLFASLTPYVTVGAFIVSMMGLSSLFTIVYVTALVVLFRKKLLAN